LLNRRDKIILIFLVCFIARGIAAEKIDGVIRGIVLDENTEKPIAYANICIINSNSGATSDAAGYFKITHLPIKPIRIKIQVIGYEPLIKTCLPSVDISAKANTFFLKPSVLQLRSVEIKSTKDRYQDEKAIGYNSKIIDSKKVHSSTGAMEDVMRYFTRFANVQQKTDLNSLLYIRGGSPDQNLVLIDDVPIYNPYAIRLSMGGAISLINSDLLKKAELLDDGFSARYGNHLSSVLNVHYLEGNTEKVNWNSNLNVTSGKVSLQGPLFNGRGSYIASMGQTHLDYLMDALHTTKSSIIIPNRRQAHGKVVYRFTPDNKISLLVINEKETTGLRDYRPENMNLESTTGTSIQSFRHEIVLNPKAYATTTVSFYRDKNRLAFFDAGNFLHGGHLSFSTRSKNIREELIFQLNPTFTTLAGAEITTNQERLNWDLNWRSAVDLPFSVNFSDHERIWAFYLENKFSLNPNALLTIGMRRSTSKNFPQPIYSPRMRFSGKWGQTIRYSLTWGVYYQYPSIFSTILKGIPIDLSANFNSLQPEKAENFDYGTQFLLSDYFLFEVHSYYRRLSHILIADESLLFRANNEANGYAKGVEVQLRTVKALRSHLSLYFAYAWAKARYCTNQDWIYFNHDRRHSFSSSLKWDFSNSLSIEMSWKYGTGFPYTPVENMYYAPNDWQAGNSGYVFIKGRKNSNRFPAYHKLDARLTYSGSLWRNKFSIYFEVDNIYNRQNVFLYDWDVETDERSHRPILKRSPIYMMPIVPMIGIDFKN